MQEKRQCAAGDQLGLRLRRRQARPGVRPALEHAARPDRLGTVFAGQDVEATAKARELFADDPPSSPSIALFKDGELVYFVPRHRIESARPRTWPGSDARPSTATSPVRHP